MPIEAHHHRSESCCRVRDSTSSKARHLKDPVNLGTLHDVKCRKESVVGGQVELSSDVLRRKSDR